MLVVAYFQFVIWPGGGGVGGQKSLTKNSEKAKQPQICPSFGGNVGVNALLPPPPPHMRLFYSRYCLGTTRAAALHYH